MDRADNDLAPLVTLI